MLLEKNTVKKRQVNITCFLDVNVRNDGSTKTQRLEMILDENGARDWRRVGTTY